MITSSSGFMPPELVNTIKGEIVLGQSRSKYSFAVEFHIQGGAMEARVRSKEVLHVVSLTS